MSLEKETEPDASSIAPSLIVTPYQNEFEHYKTSQDGTVSHTISLLKT
jgi:hypothetical protein